MLKQVLFFIFVAGTMACHRGMVNPPATGFNAESSDAKAIAIADEAMKAMGGRKAWDDTKIISWTFFGNRKLVWNKHTGDVRIESPKDQTTYLVNVNDGTGKVKIGEEEVSHPDSLAKYLERSKRMWINDSYWLVMPYKLKDSGVTLKYLREEDDQQGKPSDVLQLTFKNVGVTPDNKYEIWVNKDSHLVMQWAFYRDAAQAEPDYIRPWDNYQQYGDILLSADRSDKGGPSDVSVLETVPEAVFDSFAERKM